MRRFKPNTPYNVPVEVLKPTNTKSKGVLKKVYPEQGDVIFCSVKTFGGSERIVNDVLVLENTATVETWYTPSITADCMLIINGVKYEIMGTPENIDFRNQILIIKCKAVKGGA